MKKLTSRLHPPSHLSTDIPAGYNVTTIRILPCTPTLHYVYWELSIDTQDIADTLEIRISTTDDSTATAYNPVVRFSVNRSEHSRYVQLPSDEEKYVVAIGTVSAAGVFTPLSATSVTIQPGSQPQLVQPFNEESLSDSAESQQIPGFHPAIVIPRSDDDGNVDTAVNESIRDAVTVKQPPPLPSSWIFQ